MALTLGMVTTDTTDAPRLARWWADQTGADLSDQFGGGFIILSGGSLPVILAFQQVDDPSPGKNRLHLDLMAPDVDAEVERLVGAGATLVEKRGDESFSWTTMKDPDGNEFCIASQADAGQF
jgi:hypothetical protein